MPRCAKSIGWLRSLGKVIRRSASCHAAEITREALVRDPDDALVLAMKGHFQAFVEPYFERGTGWTYVATRRHVRLAPDATVAWFDELLHNEKYGACRGTGKPVAAGHG